MFLTGEWWISMASGARESNDQIQTVVGVCSEQEARKVPSALTVR